MDDSTEAARRSVELARHRVAEEEARVARQQALIDGLERKGQADQAAAVRDRLGRTAKALMRLNYERDAAEQRLLNLVDPLDERSLELVMRYTPL